MGIREQAMQDDLRREYRAGDLELLAAVLRTEAEAGDAGGGMVGGEGKRPDMQARIGGGYPFGAEYPFGISITGAVVTVFWQIVYRGGVPHTLAEGTVTITTDGDWVALKLAPGKTPAEDALSLVRWPAADGLPGDKAADGCLYRGLHKFAFAGGVATWQKAGWVGGDLGMMGY
jgi:hypothetical protein